MTIRKIFAIASAKGGVGKSSITAGMAIEAAKNYKVGILDADIYGPNQHLLFQIDNRFIVVLLLCQIETRCLVLLPFLQIDIKL